MPERVGLLLIGFTVVIAIFTLGIKWLSENVKVKGINPLKEEAPKEEPKEKGCCKHSGGRIDLKL